MIGVLEGFNGTILAYGQTSSGKTYTMQGDIENEENKGIVPRMVETLFSSIEAMPEQVEFTVKISIVEIYMEKIKVDIYIFKNKGLIGSRKGKFENS